MEHTQTGEMQMLTKWEVFDPRDGRAIYRVPFRWLARVLARDGRDYAPRGCGYVR